jgi:hypothetical protein
MPLLLNQPWEFPAAQRPSVENPQVSIDAGKLRASCCILP